MKNFKKFFSILTIFSIFLTTGCASIVSDTQYPVSIQSSPENLRFTIKNEMGQVIHTGKTPMTVTLAASDGYFSKAKYTVEFMSNGKKEVATIVPTVDGWYFANILLGGLIGMLIVDPVTGAMYKLPKVANVSVDVDDTAALEDMSLTVASIETLSTEQREKLILIK